MWVCVCVCVCARARVCVRVCVYMCARVCRRTRACPSSIILLYFKVHHKQLIKGHNRFWLIVSDFLKFPLRKTFTVCRAEISDNNKHAALLCDCSSHHRYWSADWRWLLPSYWNKLFHWTQITGSKLGKTPNEKWSSLWLSTIWSRYDPEIRSRPLTRHRWAHSSVGAAAIQSLTVITFTESSSFTVRL